MKRRTSKLPARVYVYGCLEPTENRDLVDKQIWLARKYRNTLVEIELRRRERFRELMGQHVDMAGKENEILELQARLEELRASIKAKRTKAGSRVAAPEESEQSKQIIGSLKVLRAEVKAVKRLLKEDPVMVGKIEALNEESREEIRQARKTNGLYWGTYLLVEAAMDAARKSSTDPKFGRWNGEGKVGVQIQGGISVAEVMAGTNEQLKIEALPDTQWNTRSGRRGAKTFVHMRVQSDARKAIWAKVPMILHRPLPADGTIKMASINRRRIARHDYYQLQIVVEAASFAREYSPLSAPMAAINFGWRVRPNGIRVAMLADEFGKTRELILPRGILDRLDHSDSIRSIRDRALEEFRPVLLEAIVNLDERPEWMLEDLATMAQWRSADRFFRFVSRWVIETEFPETVDHRMITRDMITNVPFAPEAMTDYELSEYRRKAELRVKKKSRAKPAPYWNRRTGHLLQDLQVLRRDDDYINEPDYPVNVRVIDAPEEQEAMVLAEAWRLQDQHLLEWESYERRRALGHRREIYRLFACEIAKQYSCIVIDDFDLRRVARLPAPEAERDEQVAAMRKNRQRASVSSLRLEIHERSRVAVEPSLHNTKYCHGCGSLEEFDASTRLEHTCGECGITWDQDVNHARNLLQRYRETVPSGHVPPGRDEVGGTPEDEGGGLFDGLGLED